MSDGRTAEGGFSGAGKEPELIGGVVTSPRERQKRCGSGRKQRPPGEVVMGIITRLDDAQDVGGEGTASDNRLLQPQQRSAPPSSGACGVQ